MVQNWENVLLQSIAGEQIVPVANQQSPDVVLCRLSEQEASDEKAV